MTLILLTSILQTVLTRNDDIPIQPSRFCAEYNLILDLVSQTDLMSSQ
jgi:hypothetical protein